MLYPIVNEARTVINLSGIWEFQLDDGSGFENEWMKSGLPNPELMAIPASYNDQKDSKKYRDHYGWTFYQREVEIPKIMLEERIVLRFGSVTHYAKVYWNGELICEHKGGFLPFEVEINDKIKSGKNTLCVAVDNKIDYSTLPVGNESAASFFGNTLPDWESIRNTSIPPSNCPNFDFFNYAGIHRPVKIYTTPESYIKDIAIVTDIDGSCGIVKYEIETIGNGTVEIRILDKNDEIAGEAQGNSGRIFIENAKLWEPMNAYLYKMEIRFGEDCYTQKFGIRTVKIDGTRFLINGKPFYFKGFGKHEDSDFRGKGLDDVLNVKDISLMKWLNANSFRTSHYPYSEEMMNLCDEEGIVVIDETPAVGIDFGWNDPEGGYDKFRTFGHHKDVIHDMIERDKNHPCVVMWSIANEPDTGKQPQKAYEYFKPLYDLAHECDPQNRPVTVVVRGNDYINDLVAPAMDVICLNRYYGWYEYSGDIETGKKAFKCEMDYWSKLNKPVMMTEYGADTIAGLHSSVPGMFTEEYQVEFYEAMNEVLDAVPNLVGEHLWNFADFATVQGVLRVDGNKKGIFTRDRRPKMSAHYFRKRWKNLPTWPKKMSPQS